LEKQGFWGATGTSEHEDQKGRKTEGKRKVQQRGGFQEGKPDLRGGKVVQKEKVGTLGMQEEE